MFNTNVFICIKSVSFDRESRANLYMVGILYLVINHLYNI